MRSLLQSDLDAVPADIPARLLQGRRVMTVCHENPEADALGSALAVALALEANGARVNAVCADPVPDMYDFMPQIERFRQAPEPDLEPDLIVVCDCGDLERTGAVLRENAELFARVPIIDIDHHASNPRFGTLDWVDPAAAATCEQVTLLLPHLGLGFDAVGGDITQNLTAGLVIDTANFAHPNTTPRTLRVASELVAAGAELPMIARRIYRTKPNEQLRLFGRVLARLESSADGLLAWSVVNDEDFRISGASAQMSEGLIDLLAQSASAEVAILFKDLGDLVRMSVRTRDGGVDAIRLTGAFGGGGHARAAGATIERPLTEAQPLVLGLARRLIDELPAR
ncbi:MAG TPA: DHH family phosphoesterase [Anaerolineae bacterium]|jgi:bifunctional oligoribonuclease and PAP phosphatase NrnA|nr:DHH family phosphoesterase [Anaerolineae bacterium]